MGCVNSEEGLEGAPPTGSLGAKGQIEVTYFGEFPGMEGEPYGRVDPIRQMLVYSGADWKFNGVKMENWPALKTSGKTGDF